MRIQAADVPWHAHAHTLTDTSTQTLTHNMHTHVHPHTNTDLQIHAHTQSADVSQHGLQRPSSATCVPYLQDSKHGSADRSSEPGCFGSHDGSLALLHNAPGECVMCFVVCML